ncbi:MAG: outer membrane protein assembly factor BamC [Polaribacter sp.]
MKSLNLNYVKVLGVCSLSFYISGCGFIYGDDGLIKSHEFDYVNAKEGKKLELPPGVVHKSKADFTQLPAIGKSAVKQNQGSELEQSAPVQILAVLENTRADSQSSLPAVYILDQALFVWEAVQKFLKKYNIEAKLNDEDKAIVITNWVAVDEKGIWIELDGSEEAELGRAKFSFKIVKSDIPNEIKLIVERNASEHREDEDDKWSSALVSWADSADMMNLFLSYYDKQIQIRQHQYLQKVMAGFKVELGQNNQNETILVTEARHSLVWEKTAKVMLELGLTIIDKDVRQNTYFMELKDPEPGFFASLFDESKSTLPIDAGTYQVVVDEFGDNRSILIRDEQGLALDSSLVVKLFPQLSKLFGDRR